METLRKYIQRVILEDEDVLKRWAKKGATGNEEILLKLGLTPVPHGSRDDEFESSFIGEGSYQKAYEVIWKGKRAVAKVTDSESDVDAMLDFNQMKQELPKDLQKHVLNVYDYYDKEDTESDVSIVVVEYLVSIPKSLVRDAWAEFIHIEEDPYRKERTETISREDIEQIVVSAFEEEMKGDRNRNRLLSSKESINKIVDELITMTSNVREYEPGKFTLDKTDVSDLKETLYDVIDKNGILDTTLVYSILEYIQKAVNLLLNKVSFPVAHDYASWMKKKTLRHPDKRVSDFMKFLMYLHENKGIEWYDIHDENIMMRPETGDFVLSDPGLFTFN